jgi:hypothetical protein
VIAMITFWVPLLKIAITASAMMISGNAMNTSRTRWNTKSTQPPK